MVCMCVCVHVFLLSSNFSNQKNAENAAVSKQIFNKSYSKSHSLKVVSKLFPMRKMYMTIVFAQKKKITSELLTMKVFRWLLQEHCR